MLRAGSAARLRRPSFRRNPTLSLSLIRSYYSCGVYAPDTAYVTFTFARAGDLTCDTPTGIADASDWVSSKFSTVGDGYELLYTINNGYAADVTSVSDTWYQLTSPPTFQWTQATEGLKYSDVTFYIRRRLGSGRAPVVSVRTRFELTVNP